MKKYEVAKLQLFGKKLLLKNYYSCASSLLSSSLSMGNTPVTLFMRYFVSIWFDSNPIPLIIIDFLVIVIAESEYILCALSSQFRRLVLNVSPDILVHRTLSLSIHSFSWS